MSIAERIMTSQVVQSGEPFRPNDVRGNLGISSSHAAEMCRQLAAEGRLVLDEGRYRIPSIARRWLTNQGGCWPVPALVRESADMPPEWRRA